jgi:hypothetical protein
MTDMEHQLIVAGWIQEALSTATRAVAYYAVPLSLYWILVG